MSERVRKTASWTGRRNQDLFEEKSSKNDVVKSFLQGTKNDIDKNLGAEGEWILDDGELIIGGNIASADLRSSSVDAELELTSSSSAKTLAFEGDTMQWENCQDDFKVKLNIAYDCNSDTIKGEIDVEPYRVVDYGPPCAFGGSICFIGKRKGADDESEEE